MPRTLIISDTHIGDPRYTDNQKVQNILQTEKYDRLVLNGDFIDLWLSNIKDIMKDPLYQLLKEIASDKEVVWVRGNHDWGIEVYKYCGFLPRAYIVSSLELDEDDHKILILHGNQVCSHQNRSWINRLASKMNRWIVCNFGVDFQTIANKTWFYRKHIAALRLKVLRQYGNGVETIIMGHTHLIGYSTYNKTTLFDIGSSIKTRSYAVIDKGVVWIKLENG